MPPLHRDSDGGGEGAGVESIPALSQGLNGFTG